MEIIGYKGFGQGGNACGLKFGRNFRNAEIGSR